MDESSIHIAVRRLEEAFGLIIDAQSLRGDERQPAGALGTMQLGHVDGVFNHNSDPKSKIRSHSPLLRVGIWK
jgi:hypothetical protein